MRVDTAPRLAGYATALAVAFGAAWGIGVATAPAAPAPAAPAPTAPTTPQDDSTPGMDMGGMDMGAGHSAGSDGLASTSAGYTLVPRAATFTPGRPGELAFTVTGDEGRPVTRFDPARGTRMHLSVVRRDAAGFQQPDAVLGPDGVWRAPLVLPAAGVYRLYAGFAPSGGPPLVLGTDLFAPGDFTPISFAPSRVAQVDGYQVRLDGDLVAGRTSQVFATVSRDSRAVTDLEPQHGAFGDLTVLRRSDLAAAPVAPGEGPAPAPSDRSGPGIAFTAQVPTTGDYRVFLTFRHAGAVHVAEFTLSTREGS